MEALQPPRCGEEYEHDAVGSRQHFGRYLPVHELGVHWIHDPRHLVGQGLQRYRGAELTNYLRPKVKVECVVASGDVQTVVDTILKHARTGSIGDGKVFVMPVEEAYRIRTGESGEETLQAHPDFAAQA